MTSTKKPNEILQQPIYFCCGPKEKYLFRKDKTWYILLIPLLQALKDRHIRGYRIRI